MISTLENKSLKPFPQALVPIEKPPNDRLPDHAQILDGILGGCGLGPVGDPNTWLPELWQALLDHYGPSSVLDLGCGFGYSTKWFEDHGCEVVGLEGSSVVVAHAVTPAVTLHDFTLEKPVGLPEFDLCWCSEFLEHVEARFEPCYFAALVRCRRVIVSAALPGFGGHHHVNEQPSEYWIERFEAHGFRYDPDVTSRLRDIAFVSNRTSYFPLNGLVFERVKHVEPAPLWTDIDGWLTRQQGDFLQSVVKGKTVLELGSHLGRSTVCMAKAAKQVTAVDRFDDRLHEFLANVKTHEVTGKVEEIIGDIDELRDTLVERRWDAVFIDGDHEADAVERDTALAMECLQPGGRIVWHDFNYPTVKEGVFRTGLPPESVKDLDSCGYLETARYQVMVCVPHSRGVETRTMKAAMRGCVGRAADQRGFLDLSYGCLEHNFNVLLAHCLGMRDQGLITHMAMLHSDVWADAGWVDILAEEMCLKRVAVMSANVAIKDPDDDRTSTAVGLIDDPWRLSRFIRLADQPRMPQTFMEQDVCSEDGTELLLINTGCMLIDLSYEFWDRYAFHVESRILPPDEKGARTPQFQPEDWLMSRDLHKANIPYGATWRVVTHHVGVDDWESRPTLLGRQVTDV
jgi:predicted O-methyltransferase YrrM